MKTATVGFVGLRVGLRALVPALLLLVAVWRGAARAESDWVIASASVREMNYLAVSNGSGYAIVVTNAGAGVERRCYLDGHHFLSILNEGGIFALRPHPGVDPNGWGSTLYLQPFLPGATLRGTVITNASSSQGGIEVGATGIVSRFAAGQYGTWEISLQGSYDRAAKKVRMRGFYSIVLSGVLHGAGDLNLAKLASNYLDDVPLDDGTTNDTGDMTCAHVEVGPFVTDWHPDSAPGFFPNNQSTVLLVNAIGDFNRVDTRAQGFHAIQAAYKPTVKLTFASRLADGLVSFGGFYDTGKSKDFTADNIGITPLVLTNCAATQFQFDVSIESSSLAGDGFGVVADLTATGITGAATVEVHYVVSITNDFRRFVGDLKGVGPVSYTGTVTVPFTPGAPCPTTGFFRLEVWVSKAEAVPKKAEKVRR